MKAAYFIDGRVEVGSMPDPTPGKGQVLVRTHSCGMCASDSHFLTSGKHVIELCKKHGGPYAALDFSKAFVPGHEFVGEILDYGPGSRKPLRVGSKVTSMPLMLKDGGHAVIGYDNHCPGGFGEYMLLDENLMIEVPAELDDDIAAMTEPLAVGLEHARRGAPTKDDVALVLGCGAIGLGVIAGLKLMGIGPIVAADFHESRRLLALDAGADIVIDPKAQSAYEPLPDLGQRQVNLVYECVGLPGLLQNIIQSVAFGARIVMGGYCMEPDQFLIFAAQNKRLTVHFAGGEEPQDMALALQSICDGRVDVSKWVGARIGLNGVGKALSELSGPAAPVRTVVDPRSL